MAHLPRIAEYTILTSSASYDGGSEDLEANIASHIASGWQPIGGVSMVNRDAHAYGNDYSVIVFAQAMVKYEEGEAS